MPETNPRDIAVESSELYWIPVHTRVPLKFGTETLTSVLCVRVHLKIMDRSGRSSFGWGETPLNVQWVWPSPSRYADRLQALVQFTQSIARVVDGFRSFGHPLELGSDFIDGPLHGLWNEVNAARLAHSQECIPWLAALVCFSAFDLALHDAYGVHHQMETYQCYGTPWMNRDLADFLETSHLCPGVDFHGQYPSHYLLKKRRNKLTAWHLVGGLDPLTFSDLDGSEPGDGYPVSLQEWIHRDQLQCLKIKLRGNDAIWDYQRLIDVHNLSRETTAFWLTADFNCTVSDPAYVNEILDQLRDECPQAYARLLYVEQPFPYDLERYRIPVRSVAARKPLFMDESAHDWRMIRSGFELGWSGVALKTCKTQTGAILSACWAQAHGMTLMVQDLTNPMLAQIPHCLLAAHLPTIMGVETNSMQFYPDASAPERAVHPGIYTRDQGIVDLSSLGITGFGYRADEMNRQLPPPGSFPHTQ